MASRSHLPPETLEQLNLYLESRQWPLSRFTKSEQTRIKFFVDQVQRTPALQDAIREHLTMADGNAASITPPDEGPLIGYASTVFSSPPPSTIGRGEQVLSPTFLRSRKADTWKDFMAAEAQSQAQAQHRHHYHHHHHSPAPSAPSDRSPTPRPGGFPPTPTHMPSFASAPSQGVPPDDGDENDNINHPKTVEEAYECVQRLTEKWAFHMKASLLTEAELNRATAFCFVLAGGQQNQMSPGMPMPVSVTPVPVSAVQTPTLSNSGHAEDLLGLGDNWERTQPAVAPNHGHTFPPRNKNVPGMAMNQQQQQQQQQQQRCMSSVSTSRPGATSIFSGMNQQEKEGSLMGLGIMSSQPGRFRHEPEYRPHGEGPTGMLGPGQGQASRMA